MPLTAGEVEFVITAKTEAIEAVERAMRQLGTAAAGLGLASRAAFDMVRKESDETEKSLVRMVRSFSGAETIKEASLMTEAIRQVGGVSKLTAEEQKRANTVIQEATEKMRLLGQTVPAAMKQASTALQQANQDTFKLSDTMKGVLMGAVAGVSATLTNMATNAIQSAITGIGDLIARGGQMSGMTHSFVALSGGAEIASDRINVVRDATSGLISKFEIMKALNKAVLLDLGLSSNEMAELAKTATILGRAMGQDATKSLDDLITALGRTSPLILDNLGLAVKVEDANNKYAASIGKVADDLTGAERKQAFMNAALDAAREKVRQIGDIQLTAAERGNQMWTSVTNLSGAFATWVVNIGPVNTGLETMVSGMQLWETVLTEGVGPAMERWQQIQAGTVATTSELTLETEAAARAARESEEVSAKQQIALRELESVSKDYKETVKALDAEMVLAIKQYLESGVAQGILADAYKLTSAQVSAIATELQDEEKAENSATAAAKRHKEALDELASTGDGWRGTVSQINEETVKLAKSYLDAGASAKSVAEGLSLTDAQVSAIAKSLRIEKQELNEVTQLWAEYESLRVKAGGTATEQAMAQIARWASDVTAKAKQAGYDTKAFYDALAAVSKEKTEQVRINFDDLSKHTRQHYLDLAANAQATYEHVASRAGEFSQAFIQQKREEAIAAREAARNWKEAYTEAADKVQEKAKETAKVVQEAQKQMSFTMDIQPLTYSQLEALRTDTRYSMEYERRNDPDIGLWRKLQELERKEGTYAPKTEREYLQMLADSVLLSQLRQWAQGKQRPEGLAKGTNSWSGGTAWVGERGRELVRLPQGSEVVPNHAAEGMIGGGGGVYFGPGSIVLQQPIMLDYASANRVADLFGQAVVSKKRGAGERMPFKT